MKKNITQRLFVLLTASFLIALTASAQGVYQLPNPGFEEWEKGIKLDGTETATFDPVGWNSFNTAGGRWAHMVKVSSITKKEENGNHYVALASRSVLGIVANGNMTTGIINAGALSAADKENHNFTVHSDSTNVGASHFGQKFTGRPDAFKVKVKYVPGAEANEEKGKGKDYYQAEISAWIHTDSKFQTPDTADVSGKAVASAIINPQYDNAREWTEFIGAFNYGVGNEENIPAYVLISCGTNKTPGAGTGKDSLMVDDMYFIYHSTLVELKINDLNIEGFDEAKTEYILSGAMPELSAISATTKSPWATLGEITQTVEDGKDVISIPVKGNDYEVSGNQTVYKLVYEPTVGEVDVKPIAGVYDGLLTIVGMGDPAPNSISLTEDAPGEIGLLLKDFSLEGLGSLGDIVIQNIPVTLNGDVYGFKKNNVEISLLGGMIQATVNVAGTVVDQDIDVSINVTTDMGGMELEIPVTFKGTRKTANTKSNTVENVRISVAENVVTIQGFEGDIQVYNVNGVNVYNTNAKGSAVFTLDKGIYIIRTGSKATKVLI